MGISFHTNGDYEFYSNKKYKPTSEIYKEQIKKLIKKNFKVLTIAETTTSAFYTLIVQYRKKVKENGIDSIYKTKDGHFDILSKEIYLNGYCFLFTLISNANQPLDTFENYDTFYDEFIYMTSSVKYINSSEKISNDTLISYLLAKENPLLAIKYINQIDLNSIDAAKTDYYLELKATAWAFADELDSVVSCRELRKYYALKNINIKEEKDSSNKLNEGIKSSKKSFNRFLEDAKQNRIVIINESHQDWRHRYVASILIDSLKRMGYSMLALEALSEKDSLINKRKYPIKKSGYYTQEPNMANLIRNACELGFTLFSYDVNLSNREESQAENINAILKQHPGEKLIVYCGWDHINKNCTNSKKISMACFFKTKYGFNPLTINQTITNDYYINESANSSVFILKNRDEIKNMQNLNNDYYVFNLLKNISEVNFESAFIVDISKISDDSFPALISVFNKIEFNQNETESVPVAVRYVNSKVSQVLFKLKKSDYLIRYTDARGKTTTLN